jgi:hypothetical protein
MNTRDEPPSATLDVKCSIDDDARPSAGLPGPGIVLPEDANV